MIFGAAHIKAITIYHWSYHLDAIYSLKRKYRTASVHNAAVAAMDRNQDFKKSILQVFSPLTAVM